MPRRKRKPLRCELISVKAPPFGVVQLYKSSNTLLITAPEVGKLLGIPSREASRFIKRFLKGKSLLQLRNNLGKIVNYITLPQFDLLVKAAVGTNKYAKRFSNASLSTAVYCAINNLPYNIFTGFVYVMEGDYYLKVGFSTNVNQRLKHLSRWPGELSIIKTVAATKPQEHALHRALRKGYTHTTGEWYPIARKEEILEKIDYHL